MNTKKLDEITTALLAALECYMQTSQSLQILKKGTPIEENTETLETLNKARDAATSVISNRLAKFIITLLGLIMPPNIK